MLIPFKAYSAVSHFYGYLKFKQVQEIFTWFYRDCSIFKVSNYL